MLADLVFSLQSRHLESLVSVFVHLGLDGIWRIQTYRNTNEGNAAKNYQKRYVGNKGNDLEITTA